jgi:DNA-binding transcriptional MocR family regulator
MTGHRLSDVELRRLLRPAAWTVWSAVIAHAVVDSDGVLSAAVSARSLAHELGLAKDTVAGCLQRLAGHGLIERRPQAHVAGRFTASGYWVYRPEPLILDAAPLPSSLTSSAHLSITSTSTDHPSQDQDPQLLSHTTSTPPTSSTPTPTSAPTSPRPTSPSSQLSFLTDL